MSKLTPHTETPKAHGQDLTVLVLMAQLQIQGEGPGVRTSPLPPLSDLWVLSLLVGHQNSGNTRY